jgi:hypothetical protein
VHGVRVLRESLRGESVALRTVMLSMIEVTDFTWANSASLAEPAIR